MMNPGGTTMTDKKMKDLLEENRKLKEKLAESEKRIKFLEDEEMTAFIIGDAVSDGICMVDNKGIVTRINRGYTEITGITEEEILGKSIQEMLDNGDFSNAVSLEVIRKKEKVSAMANVRKGNKQVLLVGSPFLDENYKW
jgi:PAS domain S-box-containing protein